MKYYTAYDLIFSSSIDLPEFRPVPKQDADVVIKLGEVPDAINPILGEGVLYKVNDKEFLLEVPNIARYYVAHGRNITIEPYNDEITQDVRLFLLGSTIGALLQQRDLLTLHASAVATEAGAVLFCGTSGIGKSTLAAALLQRGYSIIADDISVVSLNGDNIPLVVPGYPNQKLWAATLEHFNVSYASLDKIRPEIEKYNFPRFNRFHAESSSIRFIYILSVDRSITGLEIHSIKGLDAVFALSDCIYRRHFIAEDQRQHYQSNLIIALSNQVPVRRVVRPQATLDSLTGFVDRIEQDFTE